MNRDFNAIIFDLGGVILNIDYHRTSEAFIALGVTNFDELYSQAKQNHVFDDIETGKISENDFRLYIKTHINIDITDEEIDQAWNAMLLNLPKPRVKLIQQLAQHYPVFLYSNTNAIHLRAFREIIRQEHGRAGLLEDLFVKTYYSHELGLRKPHPEGFQHILKANRLDPKTTLFIDDSIQHIEGAKAVGLQTHHLVNEDIVALFS